MALDRKYGSHAKIYKTLFPNLSPLIFDFLKRKRQKVVIYTDVSRSLCHYGLDIIMIMDGYNFAPRWILDAFKTSKTSLMMINQLDLLSILCVVLTFDDLLKDCRVWF